MYDDPAGPSDPLIDQAVDEAEKQSFPASDPQSSWAGPDPVALGREVSPASGAVSDGGRDRSAGPEADR
jgi:hypothetical protein